MEFNRKELKAQAKKALGRTAPSFWKVALVYLLLTTVLNTVVSLVTPPLSVETFYARGGAGWVSLFVAVLMHLYLWVMSFGYTQWALRTSRGQQAGYSSLMDGFGMAGRVIILELLILAWTVLWSMAMVAGLSVALLTAQGLLPYDPGTMSLIIVAAVLVLYVCILAILLRYAMAIFLLADYPDDGAGAALRRSVKLMQGRKKQLFQLYLSFLGWALLNLLISCLAFLPFLPGLLASTASAGWDGLALLNAIQNNVGISIATGLATVPLSLWLTPYIKITIAGFYRAIVEQPVNPSPIVPGNDPF